MFLYKIYIFLEFVSFKGYDNNVYVNEENQLFFICWDDKRNTIYESNNAWRLEIISESW